MALAKLTSSDAGASARAKINAAFSAIDGQAEAIVQINAAIGDLARITDTQALAAREDARYAEFEAYQQQIAVTVGTLARASDVQKLAERVELNFAKFNDLVGVVALKGLAADALALARRVDGNYNEFASFRTVVAEKVGLGDFVALQESVRDRATYADLAAESASALPSTIKPGDGLRAFSLVQAVSACAGEAQTLSPAPVSAVDLTSRGRAIRLTGRQGIVAREAQALEVGRIREDRFAVRRKANASDPNNDTVRLGFVWLDQAKNILPGRSAFTVAVDIPDLTVASGRKEYRFTVGLAAGSGVRIVAPPGAVYYRRFVFNYGLDGITLVDVMGSTDVTGLANPVDLSADALARLGNIEDQGYGERLLTVEQAIGSPSSRTFPTRSDAMSAAIDPTVDVLRLLGHLSAGDGAGRDYQRVAELTPGVVGFQTRDGAYWQRIDNSLTDDDFGPNVTGATMRLRGTFTGSASPKSLATFADLEQRWRIDPRDAQFAGGAKFDGVSDDYPALQACINFARQFCSRYSGRSPIIECPFGQAVLSASLNVLGCHGLNIRGRGRDATSFRALGNFPVFIQRAQTVDDTLNGFCLGPATLFGGGKDLPNAHGIELQAANEGILDLKCYRCRDAFRISTSWQVLLINPRTDGTGDLQNYNGLVQPDGLPNIVENAVIVLGGVFQSVANIGFVGQCIVGSKYVGTEWLNSGAHNIVIQSPTGKDIKWFLMTACLSDTAPNLLAIIRGNSVGVVGEFQILGMWLGNAYAINGYGLLADGVVDGVIDIAMSVSTTYAAILRNGSWTSLTLRSMARYDRASTGAPGVLLQNQQNSNVALGAGRAANPAAGVYAVLETQGSDGNCVSDFVVDRRVGLIPGNRSAAFGVASDGRCVGRPINNS